MDHGRMPNGAITVRSRVPRAPRIPLVTHLLSLAPGLRPLGRHRLLPSIHKIWNTGGFVNKKAPSSGSPALPSTGFDDVRHRVADGYSTVSVIASFRLASRPPPFAVASMMVLPVIASTASSLGWMK